MHTYAGNPTNDPVAISLGDDGVDPPQFATFNTPPEGLADRTASLKYAYLAAGAVGNWGYITGNPGAQPTDTDVLLCACWDPWYSQWLVAGGSQAGAPIILGGVDGGKTWLRATAGSSVGGFRQVAAGTGNNAMAMAVSPTTGSHCVFQGIISGNASITRNAAGGGTVTVLQGGLNGIQVSTMIWANQFFFLGCVQTGGNYSCQLASSADGVGFWASLTAGLPSIWQNGTSTIRQFLSAQNGLSSSLNNTVIAMCGFVAGTDVSRLLLVTTTTATDITPSVVTGTNIVGLAYNALTTLWGLLIFDGTTSYLYTSPDLTVWTLAHTFPSCITAGLAVVGNAWVILANPQTPNINNRIFYSTNVEAGSTSSAWRSASYTDLALLATTNALGAPYSTGVLVSNGGQVLRMQTAGGLPVAIAGSTGGSLAVSQQCALQPVAGGI